jgi:hypothetical protein
MIVLNLQSGCIWMFHGRPVDVLKSAGLCSGRRTDLRWILPLAYLRWLCAAFIKGCHAILLWNHAWLQGHAPDSIRASVSREIDGLVVMSMLKIVICAAIALLGSAASLAGEAPDMTGAELYQRFCASCHGVAARGDGPVAASLKARVPDLTRIAARNGGVFPKQQVRQCIDGQTMTSAHGTREMPVWGWEFYAVKGEDAARRRRVAELMTLLVDHLESLQRK